MHAGRAGGARGEGSRHTPPHTGSTGVHSPDVAISGVYSFSCSPRLAPSSPVCVCVCTQPFQCVVDASFWQELAHRKLHEYKLDDSPKARRPPPPPSSSSSHAVTTRARAHRTSSPCTARRARAPAAACPCDENPLDPVTRSSRRPRGTSSCRGSSLTRTPQRCVGGEGEGRGVSAFDVPC